MSAFPEPVPRPTGDTQPGPEGEIIGQHPVFFPVGNMKLALMAICTFGIYEFYWFYKNWELVRDRDGVQCSPFWRTFFAPFWVAALFKLVRERARSAGVSASISPVGLAAALIGLWVAANLPDPFWLISFASFVPLLAVQSVVREINKKEAPFVDQNEAITGKNLIALLVGGLLFLLAVVGAFLPEA
jgi:hypothetical protein